MTSPPRVLITAGPTREALDPVRFLSNASSGRQGVALAEEALERGWIVDLVHGPLEVPVPTGVLTHPVTTASEMLRCCLELHPRCDAVIGAAAVSDFRPRQALKQKRKRQGSPWMLELVPTEDILAKLGAQKEKRVHAGFALETDALVENAGRKMREKNLDWMVANRPEAIGAEGDDYVLLGKAGERIELGRLTKRQLARRLLAEVERTLGVSRQPPQS